MKIVYISICFFCFIVANSQSFNCGKIIYAETFGNRPPLNYQLNFKNAISSYDKIIIENLNPNIETINGILIPDIMPIFNFDANKNEMVYQLEVGLNKVVVKDTITKLEWEMFPETKLVGRYNCLKAKTKIHGVHYTAWYTLEIPLVFGPWKLRGLPGLILEAYDLTNYYYIRVEKIIFKNDCIETDQIINANKLQNPISWMEFILKEKNEGKDIDEFYKSQQNREDNSYIKTTISGFKREIIE